MKADRDLQYMLGPDRNYEDWIWGDGGLKDWLGPAPYWIQYHGCGPDCCGEFWEVDCKSEEDFEAYLDTFPPEEVSTL